MAITIVTEQYCLLFFPPIRFLYAPFGGMSIQENLNSNSPTDLLTAYTLFPKNKLPMCNLNKNYCNFLKLPTTKSIYTLPLLPKFKPVYILFPAGRITTALLCCWRKWFYFSSTLRRDHRRPISCSNPLISVGWRKAHLRLRYFPHHSGLIPTTK